LKICSVELIAYSLVEICAKDKISLLLCCIMICILGWYRSCS